MFLIVLACLAVYIPAMRGGFIWDDNVYVQNNPMLSSGNGLRKIWFSFDQPSQYFPMVYTSFRFEYALWEVDPLGYHITNIVLHAINALLLWWVLRCLSIPGAWLAAAIFALHPVHVESVAWITERKNVLMAFFSFLSLLAWMRFADRSHRSQLAWPIYVLSLLLYIMALLSKTTACTLPAALVLLLWLKNISIDIKRWLQITPYVLVGLAIGILTVWYEHHHQGTAMLKLGMNPIERMLIAGRALWFYVGKLAWPVNLAFSYPYWKIDVTDPLQYGWLLACLFVACGMWRWRDKLGRAPIAAITFFVATLLPMLGFFSLFTFFYAYVADHYQYVASIGPIAMIAGAGYRTADRFGVWVKGVAIIIAAFVLMTLGILTWRQAHIYRDLETLWRDTLKKNPKSWMAHTNLGNVLLSQKEFDEAISHYRRALRFKPDNARAHSGWGCALESQDKIDEAISHFNQALRIKPDWYVPYYNLGRIFRSQGRINEAINKWERSLQLRPDHAKAHFSMGLAMVELGKFDEAIKHFKEALRIRPGLPAVHNELAEVYYRQQEYEKALVHWNEALKIRPYWVRVLNNMARVKAVYENKKFHDPNVAISCHVKIRNPK